MCFWHDNSKPILDKITDNYKNNFELSILEYIFICYNNFSEGLSSVYPPYALLNTPLYSY